VLSNIVSAPGVTGATITWTTNEVADTQVEYGVTAAYGQSTTLNAALSTGHSQALSGLTSGQLYHYRVKSKDAAGNLATSADQTFTTLTAPDTTPPVISGVNAAGITQTSATITWTTDDLSTSRVDFSASPTGPWTSVTIGSLVTAHSVPVAGLIPGTSYYYFVTSANGSGLVSSSLTQTFNTGAIPNPAPNAPRGLRVR
jgi:hypothetical protein